MGKEKATPGVKLAWRAASWWGEEPHSDRERPECEESRLRREVKRSGEVALC